jgi:DNA replication and repair protein RecF
VADRQLLSWPARDEVMPFTRVAGEVVSAEAQDAIEVVSVRESGLPEEAAAKRVRVNHAPRRAIDALGTLTVVLFTPRDLEIVAGPPLERRRYLDALLCQVDRDYCRRLSRYNRLAAQRNHLLRRLRDRGGSADELVYWDEQLAEDGGAVCARRLGAVAELASAAAGFHARLAPEEPPLALRYDASLGDAAPPIEDATVWAVALRAELIARRDESIARGVTTVGPHRDDLAMALDAMDVRPFGSRGQQRTVTLAIKLAEAQLMWSATGERPVLLLDDVLSELDPDRRRDLLALLHGHEQTILTTTDLEALPADYLRGALVLRVADGGIVGAERDGVAEAPPVDPPAAGPAPGAA